MQKSTSKSTIETVASLNRWNCIDPSTIETPSNVVKPMSSMLVRIRSTLSNSREVLVRLGSTQSLDEIDKLEVWHDGSGVGHGWLLDYIAVTDNRTGEEACFFVGEFLNEENGGVEEKHLTLNKQTVDNRPCREHQFDGNELTITETDANTHPPSVYQQTYRIETKTGRLEKAFLETLESDRWSSSYL